MCDHGYTIWPSTLPPCPILASIAAGVVAAGADLIDRGWKMEPNTMDCDIPVALRFLASAAKEPDAHWMLAAADEIERLRLTDEERKAIKVAAGVLEDEYYGTSCKEELQAEQTIRALLARL